MLIQIFSLYFKHTPDIIKPLAKDLTFELPNTEQNIYLTFDDGPHPEITPWVMEQLDRFNAKGSFFLIGKHAEQHPETHQALISGGHAIGNHGHEHWSGWKTKDETYFENVYKAHERLQTGLFRPPYGQITLRQAKELKKDFQVIMWSDLSADFDPNIDPSACLHHATHKVRAGSIIVFHDSEKAWPRLKSCLPKALAFYADQGFRMKALAY